VALADDDGLNRVRLRLWQVWWTVLTTLLTVWFITLGPLPAILALVTAKHVLVAILVMGLKVDAPQGSDRDADPE
jgi:hypothetical protein